MIKLTKFNGNVFVLNDDLIEYMEETPDTIITLSNDKKLVIEEGIDEVIEKIIKYKRKIHI
ncbi:flagellar FlbD family protein [Clostridiaceae bacterium HSG29]|nr:flagellar FlbD family protein [Clostridiaceae bacterium HSG29]